MRWPYYFIFLIISFFNVSLAMAQEIPPVYSQFYMNPFVYNPAFAGSDGYPSLYLVHRRQYIGIENAPVTSTLSLHSPVTKTTAVGLLVSHDKAGIFQNLNIDGTFAYIIPLGKEHNIRMGVSAGVKRQNLDFSGATQEQLVYLANRGSTENQFQAKFGVNYRIKNFNIGFSSNSLTRDPAIRSKTPEKTIAPFHDLVFNAIYYFELLPKKVQLEPFLIYHKFIAESRSEGGLLFYYKDTFWTGASYRGNYGITTFFGLNLNDKAKFAYAYELGNQAVSGLSNSTHELQIAFKLGKEKKFSKEVVRKPRFEF